MTPQHYWVPLAMALIRPGMWRVGPRGLIMTPELAGLGDDGDDDDDEHHKIYKAISYPEDYFKNHA